MQRHAGPGNPAICHAMYPGEQRRGPAGCKQSAALLQSAKEHNMPDFIYQVAIRVAVMVPTLVIMAALLWYALKSFGVVGTAQTLNPSDMRTWPLNIVLAVAGLFAVTFAIVIVAMGEGEWGAAVAGGVAAVVTIGLGPMLVKSFAR